MSVEHKVAVVVGVTEERFFELIPALYLVDVEEEFAEKFYISANSWCNGQHFIGKYVSELDEGEFVTIEKLIDNFFIEDKKQDLLDELAKFDFYISIDEVKTFIINQVF